MRQNDSEMMMMMMMFFEVKLEIKREPWGEVMRPLATRKKCVMINVVYKPS